MTLKVYNTPDVSVPTTTPAKIRQIVNDYWGSRYRYVPNSIFDFRVHGSSQLQHLHEDNEIEVARKLCPLL